MRPIDMKLIDMSGWDARMDDMFRGRNARDIYDMGYMDALAQVDDWLDAQPTLGIDNLRPKGRWLHRDNGIAYCSECDTDAVEDGTDFCPNCGADMRGYMGDGQRNQEG